ncbi:inner-membrane translocator [Streptomyces djakartensis]|uniref:Inner-membrane translocator n=1 Tax=Streptomyces djakartensis TaxID=68193 RepID=A0ABQ2ZG75_9ACTN|nr:inner-membrane translocator [Streptomyces djakartensis]GGY15706.1 hypothetical protein GCM10010384_22020 [Streptomyces djakartensis]
MTERADEQPSPGTDPLTAGCLLLLVLLADVVAGLLVLILLSVRALGRMEPPSGQTAAGPPPTDWVPPVSFGALALAVGVTGVLLLRSGHLYTGAVQLTLCAVVAGHALGAWS